MSVKTTTRGLPVKSSTWFGGKGCAFMLVAKANNKPIAITIRVFVSVVFRALIFRSFQSECQKTAASSLASKEAELSGVFPCDQFTINRLLFRPIARAGFYVLVGLLDCHSGNEGGALEHGCIDLARLDRGDNVGAAIKADDDDPFSARRFQRRCRAQGHRIVSGDHAFDVGLALQNRL